MVKWVVLLALFAAAAADASPGPPIRWHPSASGPGSGVTFTADGPKITSSPVGRAAITTPTELSGSHWRIVAHVNIAPGLDELDLVGPAPAEIVLTAIHAGLAAPHATPGQAVTDVVGDHVLVLERNGRKLLATYDGHAIGTAPARNGAHGPVGLLVVDGGSVTLTAIRMMR